MKRALLAVFAAAALAACTPQPDTSPPIAQGQAQTYLDRAQMTYVVAAVAAGTYSSLTPCSDTGPKICKNAKVAAEIDKALAAAAVAIDLAEKALTTGENPSTLAKVKLAADAAVALLKMVQTYGIG